jgi:hypothetical protein
MVILKADKDRVQAAAVEVSLLVRERVHVAPVKVEALINLVLRVLPVQGGPVVRVGVVRKAPLRKQVRVLRRAANSCQALVQSKALSTINIASLTKVVHVAQVARAAQAARVAPGVQAVQLANVDQVRRLARDVRPNRAVREVRALVLASQRAEINLDQLIQAPDRPRKVMIGNRAEPPPMSPGWGLPRRRVVVVSA